MTGDSPGAGATGGKGRPPRKDGRKGGAEAKGEVAKDDDLPKVRVAVKTGGGAPKGREQTREKGKAGGTGSDGRKDQGAKGERGGGGGRRGKTAKGARETQEPEFMAWRVLNRLERDDISLEAAMREARKKYRGATSKDMGAVNDIVRGALVWRRRLDSALPSHLLRQNAGGKGGRPGQDGTVEHTNLMRVGLYMNMFSGWPEERAVRWTSDHARRYLGKRYLAVTEGAMREGTSDSHSPGEAADPGLMKSREMGARLSFPDWISERVAGEFVRKEAAAILRSINEAPPVCLRANATKAPPKRTIQALQKAGFRVRRGKHSPVALYVEGGRSPVQNAVPVSSGGADLQDEGGQLVAKLGEAPAGGRVLVLSSPDMQVPVGLATMMDGRGAVHVVCNSDGARRELRRLSSRAGVRSVKVVSTRELADIHRRCGGTGKAGFQRVLLVAPSSGTGALRRDPPRRWRLRPADLTGLVEGQRELIRYGADLVMPGGRLIYSTTSLFREENQNIVAPFRDVRTDFRVVPATQALGERCRPLLTEKGYLRTLPHRDGMDGYFAAVLERIPPRRPAPGRQIFRGRQAGGGGGWFRRRDRGGPQRNGGGRGPGKPVRTKGRAGPRGK